MTKYLAFLCTVCHSGPKGAGFSRAEFIATMRTGVTPGGDQIDPDSMPWKNVGKLTDDELTAIWLYMRSRSRGH